MQEVNWFTHNDGLLDHPAQSSDSDTPTFQYDADTITELLLGLLGL